ncbi:MAG: GNAT family N-acetyltransferase [Smithellaceae bacterium]
MSKSPTLPNKSKGIMHDVEVLRPSDYPDWNNQLAPEAGCSFFHTAQWADVLTQSYGYRPVYFAIRDTNRIANLLAVMEVKSFLTGNRGVSLPFTDACEPIAESAAHFHALWDQAVTYGKKQRWKYLEVRGGEKYFADNLPFVTHYGHRLDLEKDTQAIYARMRESNKRNINKARKENVEVNISNSADAVKQFCRLNTLTRRKHGLPPQPRGFFKNLYDRVIAKDMGFIAVASRGDKILAANVYLHFGKEVIYKYGASDQAMQHLRANNLVMWKAIKWSCDRGFQSLSFGRTEMEHQGLMQFKSGWAANQYTLSYYRYDLQKNAFVRGSSDIHPVYKKVFEKLPAPVLNIIGHVLYRHKG